MYLGRGIGDLLYIVHSPASAAFGYAAAGAAGDGLGDVTAPGRAVVRMWSVCGTGQKSVTGST